MGTKRTIYGFRYKSGIHEGMFYRKGAGKYFIPVSGWWPYCMWTDNIDSAERMAKKIGNAQIVPITLEY